MVVLPNPGDPPREAADARLPALRRELTDGRLRWPFSVLAGVSLVTLAWTLADPQLETWFPLHAGGTTLRWLVLAGTTAWVVLAALNWRNWRRATRARS